MHARWIRKVCGYNLFVWVFQATFVYEVIYVISQLIYRSDPTSEKGWNRSFAFRGSFAFADYEQKRIATEGPALGGEPAIRSQSFDSNCPDSSYRSWPISFLEMGSKCLFVAFSFLFRDPVAFFVATVIFLSAAVTVPLAEGREQAEVFPVSFPQGSWTQWVLLWARSWISLYLIQ